MDKTIQITVRNKNAVKTCETVYICGNSDFSVHFTFDEEWAAHTLKTARFILNDGSFVDQPFSGDTCPVPILKNTFSFNLGVYAGNLSTTTPAYCPAKKSILCPDGTPKDPEPDVYNEIIDLINTGKVKGEKGDKGDPGEKGEKGDPGEPGKDAKPYSLPAASPDTLGGVKVGKGLQMDGEVLGVKKGSYELIDIIEVKEENFYIQVDKAQDGRDLYMSALYCEIHLNGGTMAEQRPAAFWGANKQLFGVTIPKADGEKFATLELREENGAWKGEYTAMSGNKLRYNINTFNGLTEIPIEENPAILGFRTSKWPIGTTIIVNGVFKNG